MVGWLVFASVWLSADRNTFYMHVKWACVAAAVGLIMHVLAFIFALITLSRGGKPGGKALLAIAVLPVSAAGAFFNGMFMVTTLMILILGSMIGEVPRP